MRYLYFIILITLTWQLNGQACLLPKSMNSLKPERCGIRYVTTLPDGLEVLLEFEKRARVITPLDPGNAKGKPLNLRGIYRLTYDRNGGLINEEMFYLQTSDIPDQSMFFGVNEQRGELLESDPSFISEEEYRKLPWIEIERPLVSQEVQPNATTYFKTMLNVDRQNRLVDLQVTRYERENSQTAQFSETQMETSLEAYDSSTKKQFWTSLYLPTTDPAEGYTLAMLNHFDRSNDKEPSDQKLRLVSFDTSGLDSFYYDLVFEKDMDVAYRSEEFGIHEEGAEELKSQTWVFTPRNASTSGNYREFQYYHFDKRANLLNHVKVLSEFNPFDAIHFFKTDSGTIFLSNEGHQIYSLYIDQAGDYQLSKSDKNLTKLQKLIGSRTGSQDQKGVTLNPIGEPTAFTDGSYMSAYRVEENVGVTGVSMTNASTMICHGILGVHLSPRGRIKSTGYYQRPENADPRAKVQIGPIVLNDRGLVSFYIREVTSDGAYPVLYSAKGGEVAIARSNVESTASQFIYFDAEEAIVGYFGLLEDPDDPRLTVRTVEIVRQK